MLESGLEGFSDHLVLALHILHQVGIAVASCALRRQLNAIVGTTRTSHSAACRVFRVDEIIGCSEVVAEILLDSRCGVGVVMDGGWGDEKRENLGRSMVWGRLLGKNR
jgi:hypothetical protein